MPSPATKTPTKTSTTDNSSSTASNRRRSSTSTSAGQKFAGLHSQKRSSIDADAAKRRASFAEQSKPPGFLGGMWQSWVKGK